MFVCIYNMYVCVYVYYIYVGLKQFKVYYHHTESRSQDIHLGLRLI